MDLPEEHLIRTNTGDLSRSGAGKAFGWKCDALLNIRWVMLRQSSHRLELLDDLSEQSGLQPTALWSGGPPNSSQQVCISSKNKN
eukprot:2157444-Amphidinium_carterae.1